MGTDEIGSYRSAQTGLAMGKLRRLEIYTNSTLFTEEKETPATPDEKLAASALMTLLASPSPSGARRRESFGFGPALKRQKSDKSLQRRAAERCAERAEQEATTECTATALMPTECDAPDDRNILAVVTNAMGGQPDQEKLAEASKWLYRRVELVRGKYKG